MSIALAKRLSQRATVTRNMDGGSVRPAGDGSIAGFDLVQNGGSVVPVRLIDKIVTAWSVEWSPGVIGRLQPMCEDGTTLEHREWSLTLFEDGPELLFQSWGDAVGGIFSAMTWARGVSR